MVVLKNYYQKHYSAFTEDFLLQSRLQKVCHELELLLSQQKIIRILDVGCGNGTLLRMLKKKFPQHIFYGADISDVAINSNKKKYLGINWSTIDCNEKIYFKSLFFDIVIAGEVIEHLYDTDTFFQESYRILKKRGRLLITTPNLASWMDRLFLLFGLQPFSTDTSKYSRIFGRELFYKIMGITDSESINHLRCFTKGALKSLLVYFGFIIEKDIPCYFHELKINRYLSIIFPSMSQNIFLIVKKE